VNDPEAGSLLRKMAASWPVEAWRDVTVLVAISGGADSVALARGLHTLHGTGPGTLVLAHYNHRQRGNESDADERFVADLAAKLHCPLVAARADSEEAQSEDALRRARYTFLTQAANESGARYVATAHTADDQVETVLLNVLRGTGLAGLAGIPRIRELNEAASLIRPLLDVRRSEVLSYLGQLGQSYREDASNASLDFTRNRIRHELLPHLEEHYNPHVREALLRLAKVARSVDESGRDDARQQLNDYCRHSAHAVEIQAEFLRLSDEAAAREVLREAWRRQEWPLAEMTYQRWEELLGFARQPPPFRGTHAAPRMFPGGVRAELSVEVLRLAKRTGDEFE
jgi:tRNA(Ile)-lysidine synthase